jgi:hypothetical protein
VQQPRRIATLFLILAMGSIQAQSPSQSLIIPPLPAEPPAQLPAMRSDIPPLIIPVKNQAPVSAPPSMGDPLIDLPPAPEIPQIPRAPGLSGAVTGTVGIKPPLPATKTSLQSNERTTPAPIFPPNKSMPVGRIEVRDPKDQLPLVIPQQTVPQLTPNGIDRGIMELPPPAPSTPNSIQSTILIEPLVPQEPSTTKRVAPSTKTSNPTKLIKKNDKIVPASLKTQTGDTTSAQQPAPTSVASPSWAVENPQIIQNEGVVPFSAAVQEWWSPNGLPRVELSAGYLLWWMKSQNSPGLVGRVPVTSVTATRIAPSMIQNLFPKDNLAYEVSGGVRGNGIFWIDQKQRYGVELGYFWSEKQDRQNLLGGNGNDITGLSFINTGTGLRDLVPLSIPNFIDGTTRISHSIQMQGGEFNIISRGFPLYQRQLQLLMGVRYFELKEGLEIDTRWASPLDPSSVRAIDSFVTKNRFYGGQLGAKYQFETEHWTLNLVAKLAVGQNDREVRIAGNTTLDTAGSTTRNFTGGVYGVATNIGTYTSSATSLVPEFQATLGYKFTKNVSGFVGYNFLAMTEVVRPGDQIDPYLNPDLVPVMTATGSSQVARPGFLGTTDWFWAQGIQLGLSINY